MSEGWKRGLPESADHGSLPPRCVVITFDDGLSSDLIAAVELRRRAAASDLSVTWSRLGGAAGLLSQHEVQELRRDGSESGRIVELMAAGRTGAARSAPSTGGLQGTARRSARRTGRRRGGSIGSYNEQVIDERDGGRLPAR